MIERGNGGPFQAPPPEAGGGGVGQSPDLYGRKRNGAPNPRAHGMPAEVRRRPDQQGTPSEEEILSWIKPKREEKPDLHVVGNEPKSGMAAGTEMNESQRKVEIEAKKREIKQALDSLVDIATKEYDANQNKEQGGKKLEAAVRKLEELRGSFVAKAMNMLPGGKISLQEGVVADLQRRLKDSERQSANYKKNILSAKLKVEDLFLQLFHLAREDASVLAKEFPYAFVSKIDITIPSGTGSKVVPIAKHGGYRAEIDMTALKRHFAVGMHAVEVSEGEPLPIPKIDPAIRAARARARKV